MSFQAAVGTWFAAHLITDKPVGERFGLVADASPIALRFETGDGLDDIMLSLTGGGVVNVQCKTRLSLAPATDSDLAKTIAQLVGFLVDARTSGTPPDPTKVAAVLAVAEDAPQTLDHLEKGCRAFDLGGDWPGVFGRVSEKQRTALKIFAEHARVAWRAKAGAEAVAQDLVDLARLFRIRRFGQDETSSDWREASRLVGARLFGQEDAGRGPVLTLLKTVRQLIRSGAEADRPGLVRALRSAGHVDTRSPRFDEDIQALRKYSQEESERLARHSRLPIDGGTPLIRACQASLNAAINGGSLLIIGEPGAGKTGVLVSLASQLITGSAPFVFFSVERFVGITKQSDFRDELRLRNDLLEVLAAWPGIEPGILIIDALDASRAGPSEVVIACLIEEVVRRLGDRWSVVASIRTFDLLNGRRFHDIMRGAPPVKAFAEPNLAQVRHFLIPRLSDSELSNLANASPSLARLERMCQTAPPALKDLLCNIFNLSLAAELIESGVSTNNICAITTQSKLIDLYEDNRLSTQPLRRAAQATIAAMVERRRLTVPQTRIQHDGLDDVLRSGVLVKAQDSVSFAHHILFDHIAGRFYLEYDDRRSLCQQISSDTTLGLLLGPALRFALERLWQDDTAEKLESWRLAFDIVSATTINPILLSSALRTVVDSVDAVPDVRGLIKLVDSTTDREAVGTLLSRLARFVSISMTERDSVSVPVATAWATVAERAASRGVPGFADGARCLLLALFDRGAFEDLGFAAAFGSAARALLALAWSLDPEFPSITVTAIRFVAKSFGSNPTASRALLQRILEEPRFTAHAHEEAPWLADGIRSIIPHDPAFAADVYATLFRRAAPQEGTSWLGGHGSQILALTSNRRQDYEHARWHLGRALSFFLESHPKYGVLAVIGASLGHATQESARPLEIRKVQAATRSISVIEDFRSLQDWRQRVWPSGGPDNDALETFTQFLRTTDQTTFRLAIETACETETGTSVWARLLGIAAERTEIAGDLLWPLVIQPGFLSMRGLRRDAVEYLAAVYPSRSFTERTDFETMAIVPDNFTDESSQNGVLTRFLSRVAESSLATREMCALRQKLRDDHRLRGNSPLVSIDIRSGPAEDITERFLAAKGVDLELEPDRSIRTASRALEEMLKPGQTPDTTEALCTLWRLTRILVEAIDSATQPQAHPAHAGIDPTGEPSSRTRGGFPRSRGDRPHTSPIQHCQATPGTDPLATLKTGPPRQKKCVRRFLDVTICFERHPNEAFLVTMGK